MSILYRLRRRLRALLAKPALDREMDDEMRLHLELESEELTRGGLDATEAARRARVAFGGIERHKEEARDARGVRPIEDRVRDLAYIMRSLRRAPAFTLAVVLSLALGIGANSTMFAFIHAVLLRPLPYANAGELIGVSSVVKGVTQDQVLEPHFREWQRASRTIASVAIYNRTDATVAGNALAERVVGTEATAELFGILGLTPELGRFFSSADQDSAAAPVVVLGDAVWRTHFGADSGIIGRMIQFNDRPRMVIGVLRGGLEFPPHSNFILPWKRPSGPNVYWWGSVVARPRPGIPLSAVQSELTNLSRRADAQLVASSRGMEPLAMPLHDQFFGSARPALTILFGAVLLLLLIACANVANLVFARTVRRQREFAVRVTLGASRRTLIGLVLAESGILALAGATAGLLVSVWTTRLFVGLSPEAIATAGGIALNGRVVAFTALITLCSALLVGIGPALRAARRDPRSALGGGGAREGSGRFAARLRRTLVAAQLAIAVVLLAGAGLLIRSLDRLASVELGFRPDHMLVVNLSLPNARYPGSDRVREFFDRLATRLAGTPGVVDVAYGSPPLRGVNSSRTLPVQSAFAGVTLSQGTVGGRFFETFGVPVRAGRGILATDDSSSAPVAVLNAAAAKIFFPNGDAVGQQFDQADVGDVHRTIVGVVADFPQSDVAVRAVPEVFLASAQGSGRPYTISLRTSGDPAAMLPFVRSAIRGLDPALAVGTATTMEKIVASSTAPARFASLLLGVFAALALALAALGLYGVIAYGVAQRSREFGIRAALGATGPVLVKLVAGEMVWVIGLGLTAGLAGAWMLSEFMRKLLYGTGVHDPLTFVLVPVALVIVATIATVVPARRAMRVNPLEVIHAE